MLHLYTTGPFLDTILGKSNNPRPGAPDRPLAAFRVGLSRQSGHDPERSDRQLTGVERNGEWRARVIGVAVLTLPLLILARIIVGS